MLALLLFQIVSVFGTPSRDGEVVSYDRFGAPDVQLSYLNRAGGSPPEFMPIVGSVTLQDGRVFTAEIPTAERIYDTESVDTYRGWATFKNGRDEILGLHVWEIARGDGLIEVAFTISNGTYPFSGAVYYSSLSIAFRTNFGVYAITRPGESINSSGYMVVPSGKHYFPPRFEFTRRFVLYKKGLIRLASDDRKAKRYFDREFVSYPAVYNNYGPLKSAYHTILSDPPLRQEALRLRAAISGNYTDTSVDITRKQLGPFALMGYAEPGAVGGTSIRPSIRNNPSRDYALFAITAADIRQERMPIAAYTRVGGYPMRPEVWAAGRPSQGFEYRLTRGIDGIVQIPAYFPKKFNSGTCDYEYELTHTLADDEQHLCRYMKLQQDAVWLLNDPVSKHRMQMVAADCQISWTIYGQPPFTPSYGGEWLPFSLQSDLLRAKSNPGKGSRVLRSTGWTLDAVASATAITPLGDLRNEHIKWARSMLDLVEISVLPNGVGIDGRYPYESNGVPWSTYGVPQNFGVAPMFQVPIWASGIYAMTRNVPWNTASVIRKTILKSADGIYFQTPKVPSIWGGNAVGPPYYIVVSKDGIPTNSITEGFGASHWIHCWHHLALAYKVSGDTKYLNAMSLVGAPGNDLLKAFSTSADRTWLIEAEEVLLGRGTGR